MSHNIEHVKFSINPVLSYIYQTFLEKNVFKQDQNTFTCSCLAFYLVVCLSIMSCTPDVKHEKRRSEELIFIRDIRLS